MGRDSRSEGCVFAAPNTGWTFFPYICCKNCNDICLKRPKINEKEAGVGRFKKKLHPKQDLM